MSGSNYQICEFESYFFINWKIRYEKYKYASIGFKNLMHNFCDIILKNTFHILKGL